MLIANVNGISETVMKITDESSKLGRFCWVQLGNTCIPCLLRKNEKYVPVRIAENKILHYFLQHFNAEMHACITVKSFNISKTECSLLNSINHDHCNNAFGKDEFIKDLDLIVKFDDLKEYYQFLDLCYNKLMHSSSANGQNNRMKKCGFIRINRDSVVPYVIKDNIKYIPLFYFIGEIDSLETEAILIDSWDLAYLKFCCKVHGINNEFVSNDRCQVTSLDNIRLYFPEETTFEDYWPINIINTTNTSPSLSSLNRLHSWVQIPKDVTKTPVTNVPVSNNSTSNTVTTPHIPNSPNTSAITSINNSLPSNSVIYQKANPSNLSNLSVPRSSACRGIHDQGISQDVPTNLPQRQNTNQGIVSTVITPCNYASQFSNSTHPYYPVTSINAPSIGSAPHLQYSNTSPFTVSNSFAPQNNYSISSNQTVSKNNMFYLSNYSGYHGDSMLLSNQNQCGNRNTVLNLASRSKVSSNFNTIDNSQTCNGNTFNRQHQSHANQNDIISLLDSPPSSPPRLPVVSSSLHVQNTHGTQNLVSPTLIIIPEVSLIPSISTPPHRTCYAPLNGKCVLTINKIPYEYVDVLVPLMEIFQYFSVSVSVNNLKFEIQTTLKVNLFKGNRIQMQILKDHYKFNSLDEEVPLMELKDFQNNFNNLCRICTPKQNLNQEKKRQKLN